MILTAGTTFEILVTNLAPGAERISVNDFGGALKCS